MKESKKGTGRFKIQSPESKTIAANSPGRHEGWGGKHDELMNKEGNTQTYILKEEIVSKVGETNQSKRRQ